MKTINLTAVENVSHSSFETLIKLDRIFIGSKPLDESFTEFCANQKIETAIDLKLAGEEKMQEEKYFKENDIPYFHFPVSDITAISKEQLQQINQVLVENDKILCYCVSGNRVAALLGLILFHIYGHPKERVLSLVGQIGLTKEPLFVKFKELLS